MQYDLCTLDNVKAWLGRSDENSDAVLTSLIARTSRQMLSYLRRGTILPHAASEVRDGNGGSCLVLREWPVLSIAALSVAGQTIPPALSYCTVGFLLEPWNGVPPGRAQRIVANGFGFVRGGQNVAIAYSAGYQVAAESQTVANGTATVLAPYGAWASDGGVGYAGGAALVQVGGAPAPGQYQLAPDAPGTYNFNAADNGAGRAYHLRICPGRPRRRLHRAGRRAFPICAAHRRDLAQPRRQRNRRLRQRTLQPVCYGFARPLPPRPADLNDDGAAEKAIADKDGWSAAFLPRLRANGS